MARQLEVAADEVARSFPQFERRKALSISLRPGQDLPLSVVPTSDNFYLLFSSAPLDLAARPASPSPPWIGRMGLRTLQLAVKLGPTEQGLIVRGPACVGVLHFLQPRQSEAPTCEALTAACRKQGCFMRIIRSCPGGHPPELTVPRPPQCGVCTCGPPVPTSRECPKLP